MREHTIAGLAVAHWATGWAVFHAQTGLKVVDGLRQRRFAEDARAELLATGVDFTREPKAIQADRARWADIYYRWAKRAQSRSLDPVTFEYYSEHVSFGQIVPSAELAAHMRTLAAELARAGRIEADPVPGKGAQFCRELSELGLLVKDDRHSYLWAGKVAA